MPLNENKKSAFMEEKFDAYNKLKIYKCSARLYTNLTVTSVVTIMFSKILVGYDGSPSSIASLEAAAKIAKAFGAEIVLGTVIEQIIIPTQDGTILPILDIMTRIQVEMKAIVASALSEFRKAHPKIPIKEEIREGRPAEQLLEIAAKENCDLIVIGNCGHKGWRERFIGSTTQHITNNAICPVLVVR